MQINGVINLYKEKGFTSQDALRVLKGILKGAKVGHTGTLDPDAVGVLPVCVGKATKAAELITGTDKEYVAELVFGSETDTQDASGAILKQTEYTFDEEKAKNAALSFIGTYGQIPPMYSALKRDGKKLYELARKGITIERDPREITIHELEILRLDQKGMKIRVVCSKGTYIRTLCEDIGQRCGYLAHMSSLTRTGTGPYRIEDSLTLKELEEKVNHGEIDSIVTDLSTLFADLPVIRVVKEEDVFLLNGNYLTYPEEQIPEEMGTVYRMELSNGRLAGLYRLSEVLTDPQKGAMRRLRSYKMFI